MEKNFFNKEKEVMTTITSLLLIFICYIWYVYQKKVINNPEIINDLQFWGKSFLLMIPIMIVALILIFIVFAIIHKIVTNEEINTLTDEMDKLIELKAIKRSRWINSLGFILAMASQAIGKQPWVMMAILISSAILSSMFEGIIKIYFYRKGV